MMLYHVWFATKRRKWLLEGDIPEACEEAMRLVAKEKGINLLAVGPIVNHVHLLLDVPNRQQLSRAMNMLKGISARRLFERFPDLKMDKGVDRFWQHRYAAKEVPAAARRRLIEYITTQDQRLEEFDHC